MSKKTNGATLFDNADVDNLVSEFKQYAGKSTENILEISRVVLAAKKLGKSSFQKFCDGIGFVPKSATIRKHEAIGKKYALLRKHQDNLPFNWTTLYSISLIDEKDFELMVGDGRIHRSMSGAIAKKLADIKSKANTTTVPNGTLSGYGIRIQFSSFPNCNIEEVRKLLHKIEGFGAVLEYSSSLESFFNDADEPMPLAA